MNRYSHTVYIEIDAHDEDDASDHVDTLARHLTSSPRISQEAYGKALGAVHHVDTEGPVEQISWGQCSICERDIVAGDQFVSADFGEKIETAHRVCAQHLAHAYGPIETGDDNE